jgi:hypothetical protein
VDDRPAPRKAGGFDRGAHPRVLPVDAAVGEVHAHLARHLAGPSAGRVRTPHDVGRGGQRGEISRPLRTVTGQHDRADLVPEPRDAEQCHGQHGSDERRRPFVRGEPPLPFAVRSSHGPPPSGAIGSRNANALPCNQFPGIS